MKRIKRKKEAKRHRKEKQVKNQTPSTEKKQVIKMHKVRIVFQCLKYNSSIILKVQMLWRKGKNSLVKFLVT